jgi:hypothetical protein
MWPGLGSYIRPQQPEGKLNRLGQKRGRQLRQTLIRLLGLPFVQRSEQGAVIAPETGTQAQFDHRLGAGIATERIQQIHQRIGSFVNDPCKGLTQ